MLAPTVIWLLALVAAPLVLMLAYSFAVRIAPDSPWPEGFTLAHYSRLLDPLYLRIFVRSLVQAGLATLFSLLLGYPLAYYIARSPLQRRGRLLLLVVIPFWTNFLVRTSRADGAHAGAGGHQLAPHGNGLIHEPLPLLYNEAGGAGGARLHPAAPARSCRCTPTWRSWTSASWPPRRTWGRARSPRSGR